MVKIERNNCFNCNQIYLLLTNRKIIYSNMKKNVIIYKTFTNYYFSQFWLIGSLFFVFICFNFIGEEKEGQQQYQYNIINMAWADEINGTENADTLNGTIDRDKIKGFGGNDIISGREADDDISGGSGEDTIYGNEGRDILRGKAGNDLIEGGGGYDRIIGDRGNDM